MSEIDELIDRFEENIGAAEGEDGHFLLYQFQKIKNLYYGIKEKTAKILTEQEAKDRDKQRQKDYDSLNYKGD